MGIRIKGLFVWICLLAVGGVTGCAGRKSNDLSPKKHENMAFLYGYVHVKKHAQKTVTSESTAFFGGRNERILDDSGFVAIAVKPDTEIQLEKIISQGHSYKFNNITLKSGPRDSKTYFGHISIDIESTVPEKDVTPGIPFLDEVWSWTVENNWKMAADKWNYLYGKDNRRSFIGIAKKTGEDSKVIARRTLSYDPQPKVQPVKLGY